MALRDPFQRVVPLTHQTKRFTFRSFRGFAIIYWHLQDEQSASICQTFHRCYNFIKLYTAIYLKKKSKFLIVLFTIESVLVVLTGIAIYSHMFDEKG